jgi:hypothetical protein
MPGYKKLSDRWRTGASEQNTPETLAALAALAGVVGQNQKTGLQSGNTRRVANASVLPANDSKNEESKWGPAKVAKPAKVETPEPAEPSLAYRAASAEPDGTGCTVEIVELPQAPRYRKVFGVLQLRPPALVDVSRWQQCVEDGKRFLAKWGEQAEALGWDSRDLFGLHRPPERPHPSYSRLSRYDATGLIWLLQGRRVTALTADTAAIENPATGSITTYRRFNKPSYGPVGDSLDDFK